MLVFGSVVCHCDEMIVGCDDSGQLTDDNVTCGHLTHMTHDSYVSHSLSPDQIVTRPSYVCSHRHDAPFFYLEDTSPSSQPYGDRTESLNRLEKAASMP